MFKRKFSQINTESQLPRNSPLQYHPPYNRPVTPTKYNLSPMKTHKNNNNTYTKSPRKVFTQDPNLKYSTNKVSPNISNNFQSQLSLLGNNLQAEQDPKGNYSNKFNSKNTTFQQQGSAFSNISNYQPSDRNMKESKRLFTNVLSKMNQKNQKEGTSHKNSIFQDPKQIHKDQSASYNKNQNAEVTFKALKQIKMIQSVQSLPPPPVLQKSHSQKTEKGSNQYTFASCKKMSQWQKNAYLPTQFTENPSYETKNDDKNRKQKIIQLINNSFSSFLPLQSHIGPKVDCKNDKFESKHVDIFESINIEQSEDIFDVLMNKIQAKGERIQQKHQEWNSVKASFESSKKSISMNPFL